MTGYLAQHRPIGDQDRFQRVFGVFTDNMMLAKPLVGADKIDGGLHEGRSFAWFKGLHSLFLPSLVQRLAMVAEGGARVACAALMLAAVSSLGPSPATAEDAVLSTEKGEFTRCGFQTRTFKGGDVQREALCVWVDGQGRAFRVSVDVVCADTCFAVGAIRVVEVRE